MMIHSGTPLAACDDSMDRLGENDSLFAFLLQRRYPVGESEVCEHEAPMLPSFEADYIVG